MDAELPARRRAAESLFACPSCHSALEATPGGARCTACGRGYSRHAGGYLDLRLTEARYADWLSVDDEARRQWLAGPAQTEASGARHMVARYLVPLLRRLRLPADARLLSVGCGGGWDVEALHELGVQAWGIDNGGRTAVWGDRSCLPFLGLADALDLPFSAGAFDFVFSEGVIEHIGFEGDSARRRPGWEEERRRFARSLLRVTRSGGYVLVACPNRLFPVDLFHGGRPFCGLRLRPHSPSERFLLSQRDVRRLFGDQAEWVRPLSLRHFFNVPRLAAGSRFLGLLLSGAGSLAGLVPAPLFGTALSPYLVLLAKVR